MGGKKVDFDKRLLKHPEIGKILEELDSLDSHSDGKKSTLRGQLRTQGFRLSNPETWVLFIKESETPSLYYRRINNIEKTRSDKKFINKKIYKPTASEEELDERVREILKQGIIDTPEGISTPQKVESTSTCYLRDPSVKAWILQNANGICECCEQEAPFNSEDGRPYLEVHHVKHLADGGSDKVENAVAICPNCHRAYHYSSDSKDRVQKIYKKVARLIQE